MRWLRQWRRGPIAILSVAWVAITATALNLDLIVEGHRTERTWEDLGFRLGATSAEFHVQWADMWPQLAAMYLTIVVLPPLVLVLLWWRARRNVARRVHEPSAVT